MLKCKTLKLDHWNLVKWINKKNKNQPKQQRRCRLMSLARQWCYAAWDGNFFPLFAPITCLRFLEAWGCRWRGYAKNSISSSFFPPKQIESREGSSQDEGDVLSAGVCRWSQDVCLFVKQFKTVVFYLIRLYTSCTCFFLRACFNY